jgi:hypothetical protein
MDNVKKRRVIQYPNICFEGLRKTSINLCQDSRCLDRDVNQAHQEGDIIATSDCSVTSGAGRLRKRWGGKVIGDETAKLTLIQDGG